MISKIRNNKVHSKEAKRRLRRRIMWRLKKRISELYHNYFAYSFASLAFLAVVVGIIGGYGAILFRYAILFFRKLFYGQTTDFLALLAQLPWYKYLIIPSLGGLIIGPIIYFLARETKGHGVPEVMEAVAIKGGRIRARISIIKILVSAITIGSGGSVGREGPIVQIGSSAGSALGQLLKVCERMRKTLVACGAAAGIAATFNAPIGGVIFALEIILGDFGINNFIPIVLSSVTATAISRAYLGNQPAFILPEYKIVSFWELPAYAGLGIIAALVSVLFITLLYKSEDFFDTLRFPQYLKPVLGGIGIGIIALLFPNVLGVGYESIDLALLEKMSLLLLFSLIFAKIAATSVTLGAGGSGGIFAPSLFIGAMTGGFFGTLIHRVYPAITASSGAYSLVGMAALVAGTTQAPITAILILFELTDNYRIILPLMICCIISTLTARSIKKPSIYTLKLLRRNINISAGRDIQILQTLKVKECMKNDKVLIPESMPFEKMIKKMTASHYQSFPVVDKDQHMVGIIYFPHLKSFLFEKHLEHLVVAKEVIEDETITLTPEDNLLTAIEKFGIKDIEEIPVVSTDKPNIVQGMISRRDILEAYNNEIKKRLREA
jgi:CIC family chloride channel protein